MSSTSTESTRPDADGAAEPRPRLGRWSDPAFRRSARLAALGVLAATVGAVAAYQVFAPSKDVALKVAAPPAPPPLTAPAAVVEPTVAALAPVLRFRPLSSEDAYRANAAIPDSPVPDQAARPFALTAAAGSDRGLASTCLTQAVYYEAASENLEGQRAVAQVVLNRVRDGRYPRTVCGVVFQGAALRTGCQFSFTCDGSMRRRLAAAPWRRAHAVAEAALDGFVMTTVGHATHYHTIWVTPYWSPSLTKLGRIGAHIFYRWGARQMTPATEAVAYVGGESPPGVDAAPHSPSVVAPTSEVATSTLPLQPQIDVHSAAEPPPSLPAPVYPPAPVPPPYRAAPRRPSLDSPGFAARDPGR